MSLVFVDRFRPNLRRRLQVEIDAGRLQQCGALALLELKQLQSLIRLSLSLLFVGGGFFVALDVIVYIWQRHAFFAGLTVWSVLVWLIINIAGYCGILLLHEAIHALAILFWGGRPHFGLKLPLALYCGARAQMFRRNQYLVIALAPLIVLTCAGIVFALQAPGLASYAILAMAGNISGAAGDVMVALYVRRLPAHVLIEDTETGYIAWEISH